jgi:cytochrome c-type biogenesis protein CcmE
MIRWAIAMTVVAACVGYLVYSASGGSSEYYLTVSELRSHSPTTGDVRVAGVVQDDIQRTDGGLRFRPGITVVADGRLGVDGVFHARALLAKCPSRFSTTPYTS